MRSDPLFHLCLLLVIHSFDSCCDFCSFCNLRDFCDLYEFCNLCDLCNFYILRSLCKSYNFDDLFARRSLWFLHALTFPMLRQQLRSLCSKQVRLSTVCLFEHCALEVAVLWIQCIFHPHSVDTQALRESAFVLAMHDAELMGLQWLAGKESVLVALYGFDFGVQK
jgi:hypothetical protein